MRTLHRFYLDKLMKIHDPCFIGDIIDIGGKKINKRGDFRPTLKGVRTWQYVNIDRSTNPDFCCSAESVPVPDASYDVALLCEVIEHLGSPEKVISETFRMLRPKGTILLSIPFLYPKHEDPHDFQRWTDTKIGSALKAAGFSQVNLAPLGGFGAVVQAILFSIVTKTQAPILNKTGSLCLALSWPLFLLMDVVFSFVKPYCATGYFVTARKL
jgi:SAM-dependent methyltransferase